MEISYTGYKDIASNTLYGEDGTIITAWFTRQAAACTYAVMDKLNVSLMKDRKMRPEI